MVSGAEKFALVLALFALSACGTVRSSVGDSPGATPRETASVAERIYSEFAGTPEQHAAVEVVAAYRLNGRFSECLASRGFNQPWQNYIRVAAPRDPLAASIWGSEADRGIGYFTRQLQGSAAETRSGVAAEATTSAAQGEAQVECRKRNEGPSDDSIDELRTPPESVSLQQDWAAMLAETGESIAPGREYSACIEKTLPAALGVESMQDVSAELDPKIPPSQVPLNDSEPASPAWENLVKAERRYSAADWECRRAHFDELMLALAPRLADFEVGHSDKLAALSRYWADVEKEAVGYGWDGSLDVSWDLPLKG
ncbi:MAG: hypothetical protein WAW88_02895 [Nocardioides sp.]